MLCEKEYGAVSMQFLRLAHATPIPLCGFNSALFWYFAIRDKPYETQSGAVQSCQVTFHQVKTKKLEVKECENISYCLILK